jgi:hypothetical protein
MYEQSSIRWIELLRAPRVGIGAFGIGIVAAFIAGAIVISLLTSSHSAFSAQAGSQAAVSSGHRVTVDQVLEARLLAEARPAAPAPTTHSGLTVEDVLESRLLAETGSSVGAPAAPEHPVTVDEVLESRLLAESRMSVLPSASRSGSR